MDSSSDLVLAGRTHAVAFGMLGIMALPDAADAELAQAWLKHAEVLLPPEELALASTLALPRRLGFLGGRLALREALRTLGERVPPILRTARGAPSLPGAVLGSISHKPHRAVALARRRDEGTATLGVDLEPAPPVDAPPRHDIAPRILTARERDALPAPRTLASEEGAAYLEAVRLRFALKEAVYKAIDPYVHRYVRFQEVEVFPEADGSVAVHLLLPELDQRTISVQAHWTRLHSDLVAMATGADAP